MRKVLILLIALLMFLAFILGITTAQGQITDASAYQRIQYGYNWKFDYDTVRINRLHIEDRTGIDSTGKIFKYMGSNPANGNLLIGTGSGFALGGLASADGTVTITTGSGTIDLAANVTGGDITGLDPKEILFGSATGTIRQSDSVYIDEYTGLGFGINIEEATLAYQRIQSPFFATMFLHSDSYAGIKFQGNTGSNVGWEIAYDSAANTLSIDDISDLGELFLDAGEVTIKEGISATNAIYLNAAGFQVTAAESQLSGELSLGLNPTPAFDLEINSNSRVELVGTGYGTAKTVFGARYANGTYASPTAVTSGQTIGEYGFGGYRATAFSVSATADMKAISTENWTDAATGTKLEFAVNPNTTTGSVPALTIDQDKNIQLEGKIEEYNNAAPTDGQLLVGNTAGGTFDAATITAGSGITVTNGAGSITIAETNEAGANYTPTAANVTNVASTGTVYGRYFRDGNFVHVYITTTATATSGSVLTEASFTLPIASNFTAANDGYGSGSALSSVNANGFPGRVYASAANDNVVFAWRPTSTASLELNFDFSYEIK